jgi:hypothetical protein
MMQETTMSKTYCKTKLTCCTKMLDPTNYKTERENLGSIPCTDSKVELPITDHYPIIEHLFRSSSYVLHFEGFKML